MCNDELFLRFSPDGLTLRSLKGVEYKKLLHTILNGVRKSVAA